MLKFLTILGVVAALGLAVISIGANFWFGTLLTTGPERWLYGAVFAGLDTLKTVLIPLAVAAAVVGARVKAGVAIVVFAILTALSFTAEIGLYAHTKSEVVGDAKAAHARYADGKAAKRKADQDLTALGPVRSAGDIEADLGTLKRDRLFDRSKQCTDATASESRELCARFARLLGEQTKAAEAGDLRRLAAEATAKLERVDVAAAMRSIDPQAEALAKLISFAVAVEPDTIRTGLAVLIALLIELGSGLGPWLASPNRKSDVASEDPVETPEPAAVASTTAPAEACSAEPAPASEPSGPDDLVACWASEALVRRRGAYTPAAEVRAAFEVHCEREGREPLNATVFGRAMTAAGYKRDKIGGVQRYEGIALKAPALRVAADNGQRRALGHMVIQARH